MKGCSVHVGADDWAFDRFGVLSGAIPSASEAYEFLTNLMTTLFFRKKHANVLSWNQNTEIFCLCNESDSSSTKFSLLARINTMSSPEMIPEAYYCCLTSWHVVIMSNFERNLGHFTWESRVSSLSLPPGSDLSARHSYLHWKNHQAQTDNKIISMQLQGKSHNQWIGSIVPL